MQQTLPAISVIIPVFDRPEKLRQAIASVGDQRYPASVEIEIVVVDDASPRPLLLPSESAGPRLRVHRLPHNLGPAAARNAGIQASSGRYLAFLDSDDLWLAGKLSSQLARLAALEDECPDTPVALAGGFYYPNRWNGRLERRIPVPAGTLCEFASGCWFAPGSTLLVSRSTFDRVGPFDERLRRLEDLDWFLRFGRIGGRLHVQPDAQVLVAPSRAAPPALVREASALIRRKFSPHGTLPLPAAAWRRLRAYLDLECGTAMLFGGQRLRGLAHLLASFCLKPRMQGALEKVWQRSDDVPDEVVVRHAAMPRDR